MSPAPTGSPGTGASKARDAATWAPAAPPPIAYHSRAVREPVSLYRRPGVAWAAQQARRTDRPRPVSAEPMATSTPICAANPPSVVDFYNNQIAFGAIIGGHFDLNRSEHWVFRITPDAVLTRYGINYGTKSPRPTSTSPSPSAPNTSSRRSGRTANRATADLAGSIRAWNSQSVSRQALFGVSLRFPVFRSGQLPRLTWSDWYPRPFVVSCLVRLRKVTGFAIKRWHLSSHGLPQAVKRNRREQGA